MEAIVKRCAGLDVHKKSIAACVSILGEDGKPKRRVRTFATMTRQLEELRDWLREEQVTTVAMESTGVFWKPIFNILEEHFTILLCNARHIKAVPGRKTDVRDCEWIAQLLQHGLLSGSFIPPRPQRDLRDLTRQRAQLSAEKAREVNRVHKVLEDANIKLGAVATDIMGVSGRDMLRQIIAGQADAAVLAQLARRRMRGKIPELQEALHGHASEHHRYMLALHLRHVEEVEALLAELDDRIAKLQDSGALDSEAAKASAPNREQRSKSPDDPPPAAPSAASADAPPPPLEGSLPFARAVALIDEIPGVDTRSAINILAEIGCDMRQFPSHKHLSSWSKICSGNDESAGKRKEARTGKGNRWLRSTLCQVAWAASHTKDTYLSAFYHRLARTRGKKRAIIAVAHSILIVIYHMLKRGTHFAELGANFFDQLDPERIKKYFVKRLESLGFNVSLEKLPCAA